MSYPASAGYATTKSSLLNAAVGLTSLGAPTMGPLYKSSSGEVAANFDITARVSSQGQGMAENKIHEPALTTMQPQSPLFLSRLPLPARRSIPPAHYAVAARQPDLCDSLAHLSPLTIRHQAMVGCGAGDILDPFVRGHLLDAGRHRLGTTDRDSALICHRPFNYDPNCLPQANSASDLAPQHLPPLPTPHQISYVPNAKTFPETLFDIISSGEYAHIISWLPHGRGFIIMDKSRFAREILTRFFDGAKFTSFTRRLKRWSFVRVPRGAELGAYYNKNFIRDKPRLVHEMKYRNDAQFDEAKKRNESNEKNGGNEEDEEATKPWEEEGQNRAGAGEVEEHSFEAEKTQAEVLLGPKGQKEEKPHAQSPKPSRDMMASPETTASGARARPSKPGLGLSPKGSHPTRTHGTSMVASQANRSRAPSELLGNHFARAYDLSPEVRPNVAPSKYIEEHRLLDATGQQLRAPPPVPDEHWGGLASSLPINTVLQSAVVSNPRATALLESQRMLDAKQARLVLERELLLHELANPNNVADPHLDATPQYSQRNNRVDGISISSTQPERACVSCPESFSSNQTRYGSGCSSGERPVMMSQDEEREFAEYLLFKRKAVASRQT